MFNKFRFQFHVFKGYFFRIALIFTNRIRNYRYQISYIRKRDLLISSLAGFAFHKVKISDEEFEQLNGCNNFPNDQYKHPELTEGWENIYNNERILVFRRKMNNCSGVYEYRCIGTYSDISADDFVRAQYDVEYRPKWDRNVVGLEVLEEDSESGNQVVRWETRYSYLLQPRLYIYVRRKYLDQKGKSMLIISRALDESSYPDYIEIEKPKKTSTVRVTDYSSILFVRAHTEIDKNGLDFVLQYHDDQKATITNKIFEYSVNYIGPKFLNDVHSAARKLAFEKEKLAENTTADDETKIDEQKTINCFL